MSAAELAARITAASAVRADFERASRAHAQDGAQTPDWPVWAGRLSLALVSVLDALAERS